MVGKKGVVKSPVAHHQAIEIVTSFIDGLGGWQCAGLASSPITGAEGNQEFTSRCSDWQRFGLAIIQMTAGLSGHDAA